MFDIVNNDQIFQYWVNYSFKKHSMSHSSQIFLLCPSLQICIYCGRSAAQHAGAQGETAQSGRAGG